MISVKELTHTELKHEREHLILRLIDLNNELQIRIMRKAILRMEKRVAKEDGMNARDFAMKMARMAVFLFALGWASVAHAQPAMPGGFVLTGGVPTTQGVPIQMSWAASTTAGVTYAIVGGYPVDNTIVMNFIPLPGTARSYSQVVPYHVSGTAQPFYGCVLAVLATVQSEYACGSITVPAKPAVIAELVTVEYDEPVTSDCTGVPAPCSTILNDLAKTSVYSQVNGAGPITRLDVAAVVLAGGQHKIVTFNAPATTGLLEVWITASDTLAAESVSTVKVSKRLGLPGKGTILLQTLTQ
jgi:hypothetical protein